MTTKPPTPPIPTLVSLSELQPEIRRAVQNKPASRFISYALDSSSTREVAKQVWAGYQRYVGEMFEASSGGVRETLVKTEMLARLGPWGDTEARYMSFLHGRLAKSYKHLSVLRFKGKYQGVDYFSEYETASPHLWIIQSPCWWVQKDGLVAFAVPDDWPVSPT